MYAIKAMSPVSASRERKRRGAGDRQHESRKVNLSDICIRSPIIEIRKTDSRVKAWAGMNDDIPG
jgi:hypothetical protein